MTTNQIDNKVVVTGIGALTPIGNNLQDYWAALKKGVSGAGRITHFNAENFKTQFACEVKGFEATDFINKKESRKLDKFSQYALVVADEAFNDSNLNLNEISTTNIPIYKKSSLVEKQVNNNLLEKTFNILTKENDCAMLHTRIGRTI